MSHPKSFNNIAILGASRGLGRAVYFLGKHHFPDSDYFLSSRKIESESAIGTDVRDTKINSDFTVAEQQDVLIQKLDAFEPDLIIYCAGGGPYGNFEKKPWHSHTWSLELNFVFPARLIHTMMTTHPQCQIWYIGSKIAESAADPLAASYAAAKHAMKGLITSINKESPNANVFLFSPGYMDTDMLPKNAAARKTSSVQNPNDVATEIWNRIRD
jgi:short-subunit dehydrogenase